ncbi:hypothetical protein [Actinomycetospora sp.]|jgi:hypothetical protein|uniref:hypothetical protein n=1 Tax=Actinomycetospora sp. TaxID=1872135 RepID=UPI002F3F40CE
MDEVTANRIAVALEGIERHLADLAAAQGATGRAAEQEREQQKWASFSTEVDERERVRGR